MQQRGRRRDGQYSVVAALTPKVVHRAVPPHRALAQIPYPGADAPALTAARNRSSLSPVANMRDMTAWTPGSRPDGNQRASRIAGVDGQLDEAQWERAAIETMSRGTPACRWRLAAIQTAATLESTRRPRADADRAARSRTAPAAARLPAVMCPYSSINTAAAGQCASASCTIGEPTPSFPSLVVTVPAWRLLPRLATTTIRPNGFHRSPLRA